MSSGAWVLLWCWIALGVPILAGGIDELARKRRVRRLGRRMGR